MITITIEVSERDFFDVVEHAAKDKPGRRIVTVRKLISADVEGEVLDRDQLVDSYHDGSLAAD
jgi:hypothetical protein